MMWKHKMLVSIMVASAALFCLAVYNSYRDVENNVCQMSYYHLRHHTIPIDEDAEHFPSHFALYRYFNPRFETEHVWASELSKLHQPVLFIPGNSGSFHQFRSIASRLDVMLRSDPNGQGRSPALQYYAVDYGEEKSGLSGALLWRQARFAAWAASRVLSLAASPHAQPQLVLVGHSMGGILARGLFLDPSAPGLDKVALIITLGAPHGAPVIAVDAMMAQYYQRLSQLWASRAENISLISLAGGYRDVMVEPYLTVPKVRTGSEDFISPEWLSMASTSIAGLDGSVDHNCLVWCRELVIPVSKLILTQSGDTTAIVNLVSHPPRFRTALQNLRATGVGLTQTTPILAERSAEHLIISIKYICSCSHVVFVGSGIKYARACPQKHVSSECTEVSSFLSHALSGFQILFLPLSDLPGERFSFVLLDTEVDSDQGRLGWSFCIDVPADLPAKLASASQNLPQQTESGYLHLFFHELPAGLESYLAVTRAGAQEPVGNMPSFVFCTASGDMIDDWIFVPTSKVINANPVATLRTLRFHRSPRPRKVMCVGTLKHLAIRTLLIRSFFRSLLLEVPSVPAILSFIVLFLRMQALFSALCLSSVDNCSSPDLLIDGLLKQAEKSRLRPSRLCTAVLSFCLLRPNSCSSDSPVTLLYMRMVNVCLQLLLINFLILGLALLVIVSIRTALLWLTCLFSSSCCCRKRPFCSSHTLHGVCPRVALPLFVHVLLSQMVPLVPPFCLILTLLLLVTACLGMLSTQARRPEVMATCVELCVCCLGAMGTFVVTLEFPFTIFDCKACHEFAHDHFASLFPVIFFCSVILCNWCFASDSNSHHSPAARYALAASLCILGGAIAFPFCISHSNGHKFSLISLWTWPLALSHMLVPTTSSKTQNHIE